MGRGSLCIFLSNDTIKLTFFHLNPTFVSFDLSSFIFYYILFVCLFGVYSPTREFFTHMETSPLPVKGCKFWPYSRHSWSLSNEGSLTCHTCCDTGLLFIMIISEDPWHSHLLPSVWQWSFHYLFLRLRSVAAGNRTPISRMRGERSTSAPPQRWHIE